MYDARIRPLKQVANFVTDCDELCERATSDLGINPPTSSGQPAQLTRCFRTQRRHEENQAWFLERKRVFSKVCLAKKYEQVDRCGDSSVFEDADVEKFSLL